MPAHLDEAICIRQWDWSETSQTVSLLCRELGLVRGLAKGSKRPKSAFSGGIELLTRGRVGVVHKTSSDLAIFTEWDLQETFPVLRQSLRAHQMGMYFAEIVQHLLHDRDPHTRLYDALLGSLRALADPERLEAALLWFQWTALVECGYQPMLGEGGTSGTRSEASSRFYPRLGGVVDDADLTGPAGASAATTEQGGSRPEAHSWVVRAGTIAVLRGLSRTEQNATKTVGEGEWVVQTMPESVVRANRLLASYIRYVLGREPTMTRVLFGPNLPT